MQAFFFLSKVYSLRSMKSLHKLFRTLIFTNKSRQRSYLLLVSKCIPVTVSPSSSYLRYYGTFNSNASRNYNSKDNEENFKNGDFIENKTTSNEEADDEAKLRLSVLEASLPFVHTYGWSSESISKGAESLGYSNMLHGMFPNGGVELVNYFFRKCNDKLEDELKERMKAGKMPGSNTAFICDAVELRLRMNVEYIDTWAKALILHASPTNWSSAFENTTNIVDTIWHYAGDKSVDSMWYTRRGSLLLIYKSTELCLLQDKSENFKDTWAFLSRRLDEVEGLENFVNLSCNRILQVRTFAKVTITTVQNLFGLNSKTK